MKLADVVVVSVPLLNITLFAAPTMLVAVVDVVELPLKAPMKVVADNAFVAKLNVSCGSVLAVIIVPDVTLVNTTLSTPLLATLN